VLWVKLGSVSIHKKRGLEDKALAEKLEHIRIPTSLFRGTKLSFLEAMVMYLKEDCNLSYRKIGLLLDRDERNVWTVYNRVLKKL